MSVVFVVIFWWGIGISFGVFYSVVVIGYRVCVEFRLFIIVFIDCKKEIKWIEGKLFLR